MNRAGTSPCRRRRAEALRQPADSRAGASQADSEGGCQPGWFKGGRRGASVADGSGRWRL